MGRDDWFECSTWTAAERERFEEKLGRARRANRPGYLRVRRSPGDPDAAGEAAALDKASDLNPPMFQADIWRFSAALARVAAARGDRERARHWAREALEIAALDKPLAPRHPGVGLAPPAREDREEMERLGS